MDRQYFYKQESAKELLHTYKDCYNRCIVIIGKEKMYHIIIVDDASMNRKILEKVIKKYFNRIQKEVTIHQAENALEAIDVLKEMPSVDCIFLDNVMPDMNGTELFVAIRLTLDIHAPVIFCSGDPGILTLIDPTHKSVYELSKREWKPISNIEKKLQEVLFEKKPPSKKAQIFA